MNDRLPSENELAQSFGVSRPVVREALVTLNALGFTASHTGRGTFVVADTPRTPLLMGRYSPTHLHEVRRHIEVPSARLAAQRRTSEDTQRLAEILAQVEAEEDPARRNKLDAQFHISIAMATRNPLFVKLIEELRAILEEQSLAVSVVPDRRARATGEHRLILDAILRGDADAAGAAMAAHLDAVEGSLAALDGGSPVNPTADDTIVRADSDASV